MLRGELWCLPGGFIEYDEDYLSAGIREVREETSLTVEIRSILSIVSNFLSPRLHTLVAVLEGRVVEGELGPGDDAVDARWFGHDQLPEMAFEADTHIVGRYYATGLAGLEVDPDFASPRPHRNSRIR